MSKEFTPVEKEIIRKLDIVNHELKENGVSTDIDSTEVKSQDAALRQYNDKTGQARKLCELTDRYVMVEWLKEYGYVDPISVAIRIWNNPEEFSKLEPEDGALILSKYLFLSGVDLHRFTARPGWPEIKNSTLNWYQKTMPWVVDQGLIHIQDGDSINPRFKYANIPTYAKYHFDDATEELEELSKLGVVGVLIPQPWNIHYKANNQMILTFSKAMEQGIPSLEMSNFDFRKMPKLIQAYFVLSDHILRSKGYCESYNNVIDTAPSVT
jgi:hypothetical protein